MNLIQLARDRMRRRNLDWSLEEARWYYWMGDVNKAISLLLSLDKDVIQEPPFDSEEYRNGERKSATPDDEQEEKQEELVYTELDDPVPDFYPERDEDGYLIR